MKRRTPITEADKLKEAHSTQKRISSFLDEEIARWEAGKIDKDMLCAALDTFISATREIHRIEHEERMAKLKRDKILVNKDELIPGNFSH